MSALMGASVLFLSAVVAARIALWLAAKDFHQTRRPYGPEREERPVAIPRGWTFDDYVTDGLRSLRILLIQSARRTHP